MLPSQPTKVKGFETYRLALVTTFVLLFTSLFFKTSPASAQTTSLAIWPPNFEANIQPGQTISQAFRLKNLGDDTTITAQIKPFSPNGELGHVKLTNSPPPNFFTLTNDDLNQALPTTFPLKAGQTQELQLQLAIPDTAKPKDHYLTFLFSSQTPGLVGGTGTTTQGAIGSNILLTIPQSPPVAPTAKVIEFRTLNLSDSFSTPSFLLRLQNTGQTRLKAIGQIEVRNSLNKPTATLPLRQNNVLAGSIRQLQTTTDWDPVFPLGRYSATATITPENSKESITQTIHFWVLPYKVILIISLIFVLKRLKLHYRPTLNKLTNQRVK